MSARRVLMTALFLGMAAPLGANYLTNSDLADSLGGWHGEGERVYLRPDGSEGSEGDKDAVPVIKLKLGSSPVSVDEEYETRDMPSGLHISVEVYASSDFKRATFSNDQTSLGGQHIIGGVYVPDGDFWCQEMPSHYRKIASVTPGKWVTVSLTIGRMKALADRTIYFWGTPGTGALYLKNPQVNP